VQIKQSVPNYLQAFLLNCSLGDNEISCIIWDQNNDLHKEKITQNRLFYFQNQLSSRSNTAASSLYKAQLKLCGAFNANSN